MTDSSLGESSESNNVVNNDSDVSSDESEKVKLIQKIRNRMEILQIIIILLFISCVIFLGIYYEIYELITLAAVVLGWLLATYTINQFQKNRLEKELRDKMYIEYQILAKSAGKAIRAWNAWSNDSSDEQRHYDVQTEIWDLGFSTETYVNRLINQFKLAKSIERLPLEKMASTVNVWVEKILQSLQNTDFSDNMRAELIHISKLFQKHLQMTIYIIQLAKFN